MSTTTTTKASKATVLAQLQALSSGLQAKLPTGSFTVSSTVYTTAVVVQGLTALISALTSLNTAQAAAQAALVAFQAEDAKLGPVIKAVKRMLVLNYANAPDVLAVFGLKPPKARVPLTAAQRAASAAKAAATRGVCTRSTVPERSTPSAGARGCRPCTRRLGGGGGTFPALATVRCSAACSDFVRSRVPPSSSSRYWPRAAITRRTRARTRVRRTPARATRRPCVCLRVVLTST